VLRRSGRYEAGGEIGKVALHDKACRQGEQQRDGKGEHRDKPEEPGREGRHEEYRHRGSAETETDRELIAQKPGRNTK